MPIYSPSAGLLAKPLKMIDKSCERWLIHVAFLFNLHKSWRDKEMTELRAPSPNVFRERTCLVSASIHILPDQPTRHPPKLLDQLREALRSRHYSHRTETTYCHWVKRYIFFHHVRHPAEMAEPEIDAFLTHLAIKKHVSSSTQNQALCALLFLYRHVLSREIGDLGEVIRARKPKHLPVVMTREEVKTVLAHLTSDKWLMASLMYGAGLRLMECLRLRVQDVDFSRNEITVRDGKGAKDRVTMLPDSLKEPLRRHLVKVKTIHEKDLAAGWGRVKVPGALDRKYPNVPPREAMEKCPDGGAMTASH